MIIGVPPGIKPEEYRVSVAPAGVERFRRRGHRVLARREPGVGSGLPDGDYQAYGVGIADSAAELYVNATVMDIDLYRLRYLAEVVPANDRCVCSTPEAGLIIDAVLKGGAPAPTLLPRDNVSLVQQGSVIGGGGGSGPGPCLGDQRGRRHDHRRPGRRGVRPAQHAV